MGVALSSLALAGCGASSSEDLFGPSSNRGGAPPGGSGGSFGSGGADPGTGGNAPSGFGGYLPLATGGAGGRPFGTGGTSGAGGTTLGAGGTTPGPNGCDYSGTWASYVRQPVTWPATPAVLYGGQGYLQQWNLVQQRQDGLNVSSRTVPCSIFLPDLEGDFFAGYQKYGIRFPDALFDAGSVPEVDFELVGTLGPDGKYAFSTEPFATVIGTTLTNPASDPWPGAAGLVSVDHDGDGNVGITVIPATGPGYSLPPSNFFFQPADLIYIAERTVSRLTGTLDGCDEVHGKVEIVTIGGTSGINSSVIGCRHEDGSPCPPVDAQFIDANRPQFTASDLGDITVVRMPDGATCADVRGRFPPLPVSPP